MLNWSARALLPAGERGRQLSDLGDLPQFSAPPPALEVTVELPNMLKWLSVPAPKEAEGEEWFLPDGFSKGAETLKFCFSSCQVWCLSPVQHFCPQPSCVAFFFTVPGWREREIKEN